MQEEKIKLPVRSALIPNFYQNFHCLAQDCQDNCCDDGWRIEFNKKDYLTIKRAVQARGLEKLAEQSLHRLRNRERDGMYAEFRVNEAGRCAFHTPEGLCRLQLECGEDTLPFVCKIYPRKATYTPAAKEYTLSPSCEGVLQQLWELPEGVEFVEDPLPKTEMGSWSIAPSKKLVRFFAPIRALCVDILQNRAVSLSQRMLCLGVVMQRLQKEDWTAFDLDSWVEQMSSLTSPEEIVKITADIPGNRDMYLLQNLKVLGAISAAEKAWTAELYELLDAKHQVTLTVQEDGNFQKDAQFKINCSGEAYEDALAQFQAAFPDKEYFFENLMVAVVLLQDFPTLTGKEELWKSYVSLCNLYSFFRFVSVVGCKGNATKERLFHMIVMASRATLHSRDRLNGFQKELFQNDSATLAHMAILLR